MFGRRCYAWLIYANIARSLLVSYEISSGAASVAVFLKSWGACSKADETGKKHMFGDPLFFNKIAGAILVACLLVMVTGFAAHLLYHPSELKEPAFVISTETAAAAPVAAAAPIGPEPVLAMLAAADVATGA